MGSPPQGGVPGPMQVGRPPRLRRGRGCVSGMRYLCTVTRSTRHMKDLLALIAIIFAPIFDRTLDEVAD